MASPALLAPVPPFPLVDGPRRIPIHTPSLLVPALPLAVVDASVVVPVTVGKRGSSRARGYEAAGRRCEELRGPREEAECSGRRTKGESSDAGCKGHGGAAAEDETGGCVAGCKAIAAGRGEGREKEEGRPEGSGYGNG